MNREIISTQESDAILSVYPDWTSLESPEKLRYISMASVYVQTQWTCVDVDWSVSDDIPVDIKEAVAFYAMAAMAGTLFGDVTSNDGNKGKIKKERNKSGREEEEYEYFGSSPMYNTTKTFGYPDSLMETLCERKNSKPTSLIRV